MMKQWTAWVRIRLLVLLSTDQTESFPVLLIVFLPSVRWQVLWKRVRYAMKPYES